jgi:hypothetical protein
VEVDALALEDEGADAVLSRGLARAEHVMRVVITWGFATVRSAWRGMMSCVDVLY